MKSLTLGDARRLAPGDLDTLVSIEREVTTADGYAGATRSWSLVERAWAKIEPLYVAEREHHGSMRNVVQNRVTLYRSGAVDEQTRIVVDGRPHAVKGIKRGGPSEIFMELITESGVDD